MVIVPCRKISKPIEATTKAPLDLEVVIASPSVLLLTTSDRLCNDLEPDDRLADDESAGRRSGACSPDSRRSAMLGQYVAERGRN